MQDKVNKCCTSFCAKCRGDDEFDYDSEDDEKEEVDQECKACLARSNEKHIRMTKVREMVGLKSWVDNNTIDKKAEETALKNVNEANVSSTDDDNDLGTEWLNQGIGLSAEE